MKKRLLLMYNPTSGRAKIGKQLDEILELFFDADYEVTIYSIRPEYGAEEILRDRGADFDLVVCCGGDGTLQHTVHGLEQLAVKPLLGYLPSGSTNDFASNLGLGKSLMADCRAIVKGQPFTYDIGLFCGAQHFNYVAAIGAFTEISYSTPQEAKNSLGYLAYVMEGIKHLPFNTHYHAVIELDNGVVVEDNFLYASVSNSLSIGGMDIAETAGVELNDGLFEVLLVKAPANIVELQVTLGKMMGRDFSGPEVQLFHTANAKFTFDEEVPWTLDGEFGGNHRVCTLSVLPQEITIMRPHRTHKKSRNQ